jgi:uncharacterized protein (DUF433 family)
MNWRDYIVSNPTVMFGKPVIEETRIPVDLILEEMGNGESIARLLESYPRVSEEHLCACLLFASDSIKNEIVYANAG